MKEQTSLPLHTTLGLLSKDGGLKPPPPLPTPTHCYVTKAYSPPGFHFAKNLVRRMWQVFILKIGFLLEREGTGPNSEPVTSEIRRNHSSKIEGKMG